MSTLNQSLSLILPSNPSASTGQAMYDQQVNQVVSAYVQYGSTGGRPSTNLFTGRTYFDTTLNALVVWNGTAWTNSVPCILAQSAVPVIAVPSGTVATNGTITLGTALASTYASAWIYLPAGAISGGSAGLYYATFSSTTVGVVYKTYVNAATTAFTPYLPSSVTLATGSNSAYTQVTATDLTVTNVNISGGSVGANGCIRLTDHRSCNATAGNKIMKQWLSATNFSSNTVASNAQAYLITDVMNRGVQNSQMASASVPSIAISTAPVMMAVDTSQNQALTLTIQLASATDYAILEGFSVVVLPHG